MSYLRVLSVLLVSVFSLGTRAQSDIDISLQAFSYGFDRPTDIVNAGDSRLFVTEKEGYIRIVRTDGSQATSPFLDMSSLTSTGGLASERGLLGLAFHPDYAQNGYFYVNYTDLSENTRISRFSVSSDPDIADLNSRLDIILIDQPFGNHNGGCLRFGADGYLYVGLGDGGSSEDPLDNGQDMASLLGKMIRIDVDGTAPYEIPSDNPYVGTAADTLPEIWAAGLRNPWKFNFDSESGDLWIADVGQSAWEEIDYQPANSPGGQNYGWRCYEGNHLGFGIDCPPLEDFDAPVSEYPHFPIGHCAVTGGNVYRGASSPRLTGKYLYADYCSGQFWSLEQDGAGGWAEFEVSSTLGFGWTCFGQDYLGELYVANQFQDSIYKIRDVGCSGMNATLTQTADTILIASSGISYQWFQDGTPIPFATFQTYDPVSSGTYAVLIQYGSYCFDFSESIYLDLEGELNCQAFTSSPTDLNKSFDPVNGISDRVQLKWYKASPQIRYSDEDAAACDLKIWAKRTLDPTTGQVTGTIMDPDTILLVDKKKFYPDGATPREIFKWPVKYRADGANNSKRVEPNIRYQWQVRCACEHGAGEESPWSAVKTFNTPDFDPVTGQVAPGIDWNENQVKSGTEASYVIRVYPNPSYGKNLKVQFSDGLDGQVIVRNLLGKELYRISVRESDSTLLIQFRKRLPAGVYSIRFEGNGAIASSLFLVR